MNRISNFAERTPPLWFKIYCNDFLRQNINAYYNRHYTGHSNADNPDFLNKLKNTFGNNTISDLNPSKNEVEQILLSDLPLVMKKHDFDNCVCVCVPRAKAYNAYKESQLQFIAAVNDAANKISNMTNGVDVIIRHTNTCTTHLAKNQSEKDGSMPYPQITRETCSIKQEKIRGKKVILIDDIYTKGVNIDEDCIQALLDNGVQEVIFYAIARTGGLHEIFK